MYKTKRTPFLKENFGTKIITDQLTLYVNNICNTKCDYCAIDIQQSLIKGENSFDEMSFSNFNKIFSFKGINSINSILFQGKEPTLWKHLNAAIEVAKSKLKKTIVFTNGINKIDISPDILIIHIDLKYDTDLEYWKNLSLVNNFKLSLVFVISVNSDIEKYYELITKYSDSYVLLPESPIKFGIKDKIIIKKLFYLFKKLYFSGYKNYTFEHPIPYCLINQIDIDFINSNNIIFGGTCQAPKSIIVNYDLKFSFPCIMLPNKEKLGESVNVKNIFNDHLNYTHELRNKMPKEECYTCEYYLNKYCQGGCLINRY